MARLASKKEDKANSARETILNSAEYLFAERGYNAATLRDIMRHADLNLALAHYYFGTKEEIFRQVIVRRSSEHVQALLEALQRVDPNSVDRVQALDDIVEAYLLPVAERLQNGGAGWRNYIHILAQSMNTRQQEPFLQPLIAIYDPVAYAFTSALTKVLPGVDEPRIQWGFFFLTASWIHIVLETGVADHQSGGLCRSSDFATIVKEMVPFFSAAFHSLLNSNEHVKEQRTAAIIVAKKTAKRAG